MKLKILLKFAIISAISVTVFSGRAQQLTATTDTNGNFTWPTMIPAAQIGGWTNPIYIYNTNGQLSGTINPNGSFLFTNSATSNSFSYGIQSGVVIIQTPSGSQIFSNGDVYGTIGGSIPLTSTVTNLVAQNTTLQAALLNLSNQMVASFGVSNSIYQNEFSGSNAAAQTAITGAVSAATNTIWGYAYPLIATNGINATNFAFTLGYQGTNYSYGLTTNNGAFYTNLVYALAAAGSNNAAALVGNTNYFATHFRLGTVTMGSGAIAVTNVFSPPFADPNFTVSVAQADQTSAYSYSSFAYSYDSFVVLGPSAGNSRTLTYLAYHP